MIAGSKWVVAKLQLHMAVTAYESSAGSIKQEEKTGKKNEVGLCTEYVLS